jgi:signal transduction histidine kinase
VYVGLQLVIRTAILQNELEMAGVRYANAIADKVGVVPNSASDSVAAARMENIHTLNEIMESCQSAIDILNDLLLYDKLEDGEMTLDRRPVNVKLALDTMLKPFTVQVNVFMYKHACLIICNGNLLLSWSL